MKVKNKSKDLIVVRGMPGRKPEEEREVTEGQRLRLSRNENFELVAPLLSPKRSQKNG